MTEVDTLEFHALIFKTSWQTFGPKNVSFCGDLFVIRGVDAVHGDNCLLFHCGWLGCRTSGQRGREKNPWHVGPWDATRWMSTRAGYIQKSTIYEKKVKRTKRMSIQCFSDNGWFSKMIISFVLQVCMSPFLLEGWLGEHPASLTRSTACTCPELVCMRSTSS